MEVMNFPTFSNTLSGARERLQRNRHGDPESSPATSPSADSNRRVRDIAALLVEAAGDNLTPTRGRSPSPHVMLQRLYADAPGAAAQSG